MRLQGSRADSCQLYAADCLAFHQSATQDVSEGRLCCAENTRKQVRQANNGLWLSDETASARELAANSDEPPLATTASLHDMLRVSLRKRAGTAQPGAQLAPIASPLASQPSLPPLPSARQSAEARQSTKASQSAEASKSAEGIAASGQRAPRLSTTDSVASAASGASAIPEVMDELLDAAESSDTERAGNVATHALPPMNPPINIGEPLGEGSESPAPFPGAAAAHASVGAETYSANSNSQAGSTERWDSEDNPEAPLGMDILSLVVIEVLAAAEEGVAALQSRYSALSHLAQV